MFLTEEGGRFGVATQAFSAKQLPINLQKDLPKRVIVGLLITPILAFGLLKRLLAPNFYLGNLEKDLFFEQVSLSAKNHGWRHIRLFLMTSFRRSLSHVDFFHDL